MSQPMSQPTTLPEFAALFPEVDSDQLAEDLHVKGQARKLAGLVALLAAAPTGFAHAWAFGLGWSPAHVDAWLPYATAEAAAACRRGLTQMFRAAA